MRVTFHDASIHERTRITLVTITYNITLGFLLTGNLFPFPAGRESTAASSTEAGFFHHIQCCILVYVKKYLLQCRIAAYSDILLDILCVDMSAVLKYQTHLSSIERNGFLTLVNLSVLMIQQSLDRLSLADRLLINFFAVLNFDFDIEDSERLDPHQRSHLTESVASALSDLRMRNFSFKFYRNLSVSLGQFYHLVINFLGAAGNTSGSCTDQDAELRCMQTFLCFFAQILKFFSVM